MRYWKIAATIAFVAFAARAADDAFQPSWDSIKQRVPAPEWFRDAKFGIYFHWGVYSVPAFETEWYPRNMHLKGSRVYAHHVAKYGDPSVFGYHQFVPMFTAENFDAEAWADLFQRSGARFAGPVAEHHDGFAMWPSKLTPWNAGARGPKRDVVGELEKAIRARGMKLVTTFHHEHNNQYVWGRTHDVEKSIKDDYFPHVEGWPTASDDPELRLMYGNLPREEFLKLWEGKLEEVIDAYHPDLIWFDSWLNEIPDPVKLQFLAHYFNDARAQNKEVVVTCKQRDIRPEVAVEDFEKGRMDRLTDYSWLTDDTLSYGSWCYTDTLRIKPLREVLHTLIDIVSKNGQLLLNISPKADGTIPQEQQAVLLGLGQWLGQYGEAIYGTRPFLDYGEGPTQMEKGGHFVKTNLQYGAKDIRYTRKGDAVYAIALGWPGAGKTVRMGLFGKAGRAKDLQVKNVSFLGDAGPVKWKRTGKGLLVQCPKAAPNALAVVIKLETQGLP